MARIVPAAILAALSSTVVNPFYAVEMLFDAGPLRLWTGFGDRTVAGNVYTGSGDLLKIDAVEEASDLAAKAMILTLSGVPSTLIAIALAEPIRGRTCRLYFGDTSVADQVEVFSGKMNTMDITDSADSCQIVLTVESKLVELEKIPTDRYTHEWLQTKFPGDTFLSFVADMADKEVVWGRATA